MRERVIGTRLDDDNYEQFLALARSKGMTKSALAHMFILDGLAQFDRRNDALMDRVEALTNLVLKSNVLAASAVVSAALPVGVGGTLDDAIREQMRTHIMEAVKLGHNISSTYDKGTFKPGGDNVSSN
jgi:hypothetical protein